MVRPAEYYAKLEAAKESLARAGVKTVAWTDRLVDSIFSLEPEPFTSIEEETEFQIWHEDLLARVEMDKTEDDANMSGGSDSQDMEKAIEEISTELAGIEVDCRLDESYEKRELGHEELKKYKRECCVAISKEFRTGTKYEFDPSINMYMAKVQLNADLKVPDFKVQGPYMQLKRNLARGMDDIPAALAEVVRVTCPNHKFTTELQAALLGAGWNPEQICRPNISDRKCKTRGTSTAAKLAQKLEVPEEMLEAEITAHKLRKQLSGALYTTDFDQFDDLVHLMMQQEISNIKSDAHFAIARKNEARFQGVVDWINLELNPKLAQPLLKLGVDMRAALGGIQAALNKTDNQPQVMEVETFKSIAEGLQRQMLVMQQTLKKVEHNTGRPATEQRSTSPSNATKASIGTDDDKPESIGHKDKTLNHLKSMIEKTIEPLLNRNVDTQNTVNQIAIDFIKDTVNRIAIDLIDVKSNVDAWSSANASRFDEAASRVKGNFELLEKSWINQLQHAVDQVKGNSAIDKQSYDNRLAALEANVNLCIVKLDNLLQVNGQTQTQPAVAVPGGVVVKTEDGNLYRDYPSSSSSTGQNWPDPGRTTSAPRPIDNHNRSDLYIFRGVQIAPRPQDHLSTQVSAMPQVNYGQLQTTGVYAQHQGSNHFSATPHVGQSQPQGHQNVLNQGPTYYQTNHQSYGQSQGNQQGQSQPSANPYEHTGTAAPYHGQNLPGHPSQSRYS